MPSRHNSRHSSRSSQRQRPWRLFVLAAALLLTLTGAAVAQQTSGAVYGTVVDQAAGDSLPGVTVTLSGQGAPQIQVTDAQGQFRFLGLSPGTYQIRAELDSYGMVERSDIEVGVGRNTSLELILQQFGETLIISGGVPLLDSRQVNPGVNVTQVELERIPSARDPWVIMQTIPGVLVDRINIGGNESGQQSNFTGPGSASATATWAVDGVVITDPSARGSSPSYYNFDAFEQMQISTGGSDITAMTSGVQMNMVTKRGTNEWRVSGRYFLTDSSWQDASELGDLGESGPWNDFNTPSGSTQGNRTDTVDDWGADIGGPIVPDRLWVWGSYSLQEIDTFVLGGSERVADNTELENYAAKINGQLSATNSLVAFYHYGDKRKFGRGAAPTRPRPTTWNQSGPTDIWKLEDTQIFGSNLYLTGMYSYVGGGFSLAPIGGLTCETCRITRGPDNVWQNSFFDYSTERPQDQLKVDGSYFFNTGAVNHELKFGVGYRLNEVSTLSQYPVDNVVGRADLGVFGPGPTYIAYAYHDLVRSDEFEQWNVVLQDTLTLGKATVNAGVRYDLQSPQQLTFTRPGNPRFPDDIPAFTRQGGDPGFEWETISPRVGVTYALGEEGRTLLKASYSRFADQLGSGFFSALGESTFQYGYLYWTDSNGDLIIQDDELGDLLGTGGVPGTPSANQVDPDLDPYTTDEVILGVEHALQPELVIGAVATFRRNQGFVGNDQFVVDENGVRRRERREDYELGGFLQGTLPDGSTFNEPVYRLRNGVSLDPALGTFQYNTDREQDYLGLSLTANKRLADRWMLRGHVTYSDWTNENIDAGVQPDPTRAVNSESGSQVLTQSAGSGTRGEVWINSRWSANLSGLYQIAPDRPWGFNAAADINYREGFPIPYRVAVNGRSAVTGDLIGRPNVLVAPDNDSFRNDDVLIVNARLEKEFTFSSFGLTVGVDAFNLFDNQDVMQREGFVTADLAGPDGAPLVDGNGDRQQIVSANGDFARETIAPRIFRIGVRFSWN